MAAIALHSWLCLFTVLFVRKLALCFLAQHMSQHRVMLLFFASGAYDMLCNDLACALEDMGVRTARQHALGVLHGSWPTQQ